MKPRDVDPLTDEQYAKLPKWARDHIGMLNLAIKDRDGELERLTGEKPNPVAYRGFGTEDTPILWEGDPIVFFPEEFHSQMSVRAEGTGRIYVNGSTGLRVYPGASNAITIETVGR